MPLNAAIINQWNEVTVPFIQLDGTVTPINNDSPVGTRICTLRLVNPVTGTWSLAGGSWSKASISGSGESIDLVLNAVTISGDAGAKTVTVQHSSAAAGMVVNITVTYDAGGVTTARDKRGAGGYWIGNIDGLNINNLNKQWTTKRRYGYGMRHAVSLPWKGVVCQVAGCQSGKEHITNDGQKCGGAGSLSFDWQAMKGKAPASGDATTLPQVPGTVIGSGTDTFNRGTVAPPGTNPADYTPGDKRHGFYKTWTPSSVAKGDFGFIMFKNGAANPAVDYVSVNNPAMRSGSSWYCQVPDSMNLRQGPWFGKDGELLCYETGENTGLWLRDGMSVPRLAFIYNDGGTDLVIGGGYWENDRNATIPGRTNGQCMIGGNYKLRHRWRQRTTETVQEVRVNAFWWEGYKPSGSLVFTLYEEGSPGWNISVNIPAGNNGTGTDETKINSWGAGGSTSSASTWFFYVKAMLASSKVLTAGKVYRIELTGSDGSNFYYVPVTSPISRSWSTKDVGTPDIYSNAWWEDPDDNTKLSYSERSSNNGSSWSKFRSGFDSDWASAPIQDDMALQMGMRYIV